jgi:hypothetical protein
MAAENERGDEQDEKKNEQDLGNLRGHAGDTEEAKKSGDECDDQKYYAVVQH